MAKYKHLTLSERIEIYTQLKANKSIRKIAILRNSSTSKSVIDIFTKLYRHLGRETFTKMFPVILTDNGTEFSNPLRLEVDENGEFRTRVFYCDQNRPDQKGSIEVNHEFIRRVIPRGESLERYTQADINLLMSHINSNGRKKLNDKSPYLVNTMIKKIVPNTSLDFKWYLNLYPKRDDAGDENYKEVVEFTIDYDVAKDFRNNRGEMLRQNQWKDLTVRVMV